MYLMSIKAYSIEDIKRMSKRKPKETLLTQVKKKRESKERYDHHKASDNLRYCNRTLCDTIYDAKNILKTYLKESDDQVSIYRGTLLTLDSLLNEIQVYANRMEAALSGKKDKRQVKQA